MTISVKSEIDSRVVIYPLMRTLKSFGSVAVVSSNRQLERLIDDYEFQTFRDILVIVDEDSGADDICSTYGIGARDYDFIILDNVGSVEFDKCLILLGNSQSEAFEEDIELLQSAEDNGKYVIFDFSSNKVSSKNAKVEESSTKGKRAVKVSANGEDYNPADKFRNRIADTMNTTKVIKREKVKLPTFADIEMVEGDHKFYLVGMDLVKAFFNFLGEPLAISWDKFQKEVRRKDESSSNIKK